MVYFLVFVVIVCLLCVLLGGKVFFQRFPHEFLHGSIEFVLLGGG